MPNVTTEQANQILAQRPDVQAAFNADPSKMSNERRVGIWYDNYLAGGGQDLFGSYSGQNVVGAVTNPASPYDYNDPYGAYASIGKTLGLNEAQTAEQAANEALLNYKNTTVAGINTLRNNRDLSTGLEAGFEANRVREATAQESTLADQVQLAQNKRLAIESVVGQQYSVFQSELSQRENLVVQAAQYGIKDVNPNMSLATLSQKVGIGQLMNENPSAGIKETDSIDKAFQRLTSYAAEQKKQAYKDSLKQIALQMGITKTNISTGALEQKIGKQNKAALDDAKKMNDLQYESAKLDIAAKKKSLAKGTTVSATATKTALKQEGINGFQNIFEQIKGGDGYVNPKDYVAAKSQWAANNLPATDFDAIFATYRNPYDPKYGLKTIKEE